MWKILKIEDSNFFFQLKVSENEQEISFFLTNVKRMWKEAEIQSYKDIYKRVKIFNRLIQFDEETIRETIVRNDPETVELKNNELVLKYKVDGDPFKFTWKLIELSEDEFQENFTNPLMFCIEVLIKQNEVLKEVIEKKDVEIEQFKIEGNVLKRTTVATVPFDMKAYEEEHSKVLSITKNFHEIAKSIDSVQTKLQESKLPKSPAKSPRSPKNSPSSKSKKRTLKAKLQAERLKRLKLDKNKAQYEDDSDSDEDSSKNGKIDSSCCNNNEEQETELSKIQRDLETLNRLIKEDLDTKRNREAINKGT